VYEAAVLLAAYRARTDALTRLMPDYLESARVSARGDGVEVLMTISGTLADGETVKVTGTDVFSVRDGKIVRMLSVFDPAQMQVLAAALRANPSG
jgi:ketosteroid isomerase-like protein